MSQKGQPENKLEAKWCEGYFLGFNWRTSEALVGTKEGVKRAGTIRRVGGHRRWDAEGLDAVRGVPWKWNPDADDEVEKLLVRHLTEEEKNNLAEPAHNQGTKKVYRLRLTRDDFIDKGFTEGCAGCKAILSGGAVRGHTEACRKRMEDIMMNNAAGKERMKRQADRESEFMAKWLEKSEEEEQQQKKAKIGVKGKQDAEGSGGSSSSSSGMMPSKLPL